MKFHLLLAVLFGVRAMALTTPKSVFAHFIVGNTYSYSVSDWIDDVTKAQAAHLDAFALNIGPNDAWTDSQLQNAIYAASSRGFKLFLSFDFAAGPWSTDVLISKVKTLAASGAQFKVNNLPLVSTFEGTWSGSQWQAVRSAIPIFFIPAWTSIGPGNFGSYVNQVDGAFSWDAWSVGPTNKDTTSDQAWQLALGSKPYMMGVAPWFYTNLPQYNKNWVWRGDDLWHLRWTQAIALQPAFIEIITWNDYGESHYIGPIRPGAIVSGAEKYVNNMPHDHLRDLLPFYVDAYKNGGSFPTATADKISFWYRLTPSHACGTGGTQGDAPYQPQFDPTVIVQDQIFVSVLLTSPASVSVQIAGNPTAVRIINTSGVSHFAVPFNGQTGSQVTVTILRNKAAVVSSTGPGITTQCPANTGYTNFNFWAGGTG